MLKRQEKLFIKKCTHDSNPNREKINKDVVGAVKNNYTRKTKTQTMQKRILCYAVASLLSFSVYGQYTYESGKIYIIYKQTLTTLKAS